MLKTRIIPTLLWKDYGLVKGIGFDSWRRIGTVLPSIKVYNTRHVDELILVDITATSDQKDPDYTSISEFADECFVPLTVGGGIHNLDQIRELLRAGVDKVTINTAAYANIGLIREASSYFGSQCIVGSIDVRKTTMGDYECYSHSGKQPTGKEPGGWAKELELNGAGEILITSIENDGTMNGYDLDLIKCVTAQVSIPVIASGGAGTYDDFYKVLTVGNAAAVAAASMFHFSENTPAEAKSYLNAKKIPVRMVRI
jgi:cyclase